MRQRRIVWVGMAGLVTAAIAGAALARLTTVGGPVTQQSIGTTTDEVVIEGGWKEIVSLPLNCVTSPAVSADASIQSGGAGGRLRVRVVASPFVEGDDAAPVTFRPASVVFRAKAGPAPASSFTFAGSIPAEAEVALLSLQVRAAGKRDGVVQKASLRALWDARTPNCA